MQELDIPKRTAGKRNSDIGNKELYKFYKKNLKPVESITGGSTLGSYDIKESIYSSILKDINSLIIQEIILENFEFKIPYGLGYFSMVQKPLVYKIDSNGDLVTKLLSTDYKATKELWKSDKEAKENKTLIFHTNEHSNGNRMAYRWSKKGCNTQGLEPYYFLPCRQVKRAPAQFLKDPSYKLCYYENPGNKYQVMYNKLNRS